MAAAFVGNRNAERVFMKCARLCWNARMEPMCCCSISTCEHFQHARTLMMMMMASPNLSVPQIRAASFQRIAAAKCRNPREMRGSSAAGILMVTFRMSHSLPVCVCVCSTPSYGEGYFCQCGGQKRAARCVRVWE